MANYLPGMLEVPIIDGQSEDICGRDDRYYHFGMWSDFCDISINQLKLYNQFPNNPRNDGFPYQPSEGIDIITYDIKDTNIKFVSSVEVESFLTLTVKYDYTDTEGNIQHEVAVTRMKKWDKNAEINIILPDDVSTYDITKVEVSPERDAWYYYKVNEHHIDVHDSFRFGLISTLKPNESIINQEFIDSLVPGYFMDGDTITMKISIGEEDIDSSDSENTIKFKTYKKLEPVVGLNDMDDESANAAIIENAVDIIFAVDTDIENWDITDTIGINIDTATNSFIEIGQVIYDGETYRILRYKNPENLSLAYDPKYAGITRSFIINFTKK